MILLGQVQLGDGKLTLSVNSRQRMDAAKALIELIDGVVLHSFEAQSPDALLADTERDGTGPIDLFDTPANLRNKNDPDFFDEDEARAASACIAEHYNRWLDTPIPMLNDRIPLEVLNALPGVALRS